MGGSEKATASLQVGEIVDYRIFSTEQHDLNQILRGLQLDQNVSKATCLGSLLKSRLRLGGFA